MSPDERAEVIWRERQEYEIADYIAKDDEYRRANDLTVQYLATGGAVVGGAVRPNALMNVDGCEMTVQQAVDLGIYEGDFIGMQTGDL